MKDEAFSSAKEYQRTIEALTTAERDEELRLLQSLQTFSDEVVQYGNAALEVEQRLDMIAPEGDIRIKLITELLLVMDTLRSVMDTIGELRVMASKYEARYETLIRRPRARVLAEYAGQLEPHMSQAEYDAVTALYRPRINVLACEEMLQRAWGEHTNTFLQLDDHLGTILHGLETALDGLIEVELLTQQTDYPVAILEELAQAKPALRPRKND